MVLVYPFALKISCALEIKNKHFSLAFLKPEVFALECASPRESGGGEEGEHRVSRGSCGMSGSSSSEPRRCPDPTAGAVRAGAAAAASVPAAGPGERLVPLQPRSLGGVAAGGRPPGERPRGRGRRALPCARGAAASAVPGLGELRVPAGAAGGAGPGARPLRFRQGAPQRAGGAEGAAASGGAGAGTGGPRAPAASSRDPAPAPGKRRPPGGPGTGTAPAPRGHSGSVAGAPAGAQPRAGRSRGDSAGLGPSANPGGALASRGDPDP